MSDLFGWDLIYKLSESDLKKKEDVLTLFIHFLLIKGGYKCIGLGEDKTLTGNEVPSETLPAEWNSNPSYSIKYSLDNNLYVLKGVPVENSIVYNLVRMPMVNQGSDEESQINYKFDFKKFSALNDAGPDVKVTNVAFTTDEVVSSLRGDLATLIPTYEDVHKKILSDLISPMGSANTKEATTQATAPETSQQGSNAYRAPQRPATNDGYPPDIGQPSWPYDPERDPLRVGRSDLDPFGQGGGMIFNPFGRNPPFANPSGGFPGGPALPRGAIPPGARFDPFGPGLPNPPRHRRPPGSDEFHPPGFGDMFM